MRDDFKSPDDIREENWAAQKYGDDPNDVRQKEIFGDDFHDEESLKRALNPVMIEEPVDLEKEFESFWNINECHLQILECHAGRPPLKAKDLAAMKARQKPIWMFMRTRGKK